MSAVQTLRDVLGLIAQRADRTDPSIASLARAALERAPLDVSHSEARQAIAEIVSRAGPIENRDLLINELDAMRIRGYR